MHDQTDATKLLLAADADPYTEDELGGYVPQVDIRFMHYAYQVATAPPLT